jgi:hypothetical protein
MEIQEVLALYNSQKVYQIKELPIMPELVQTHLFF